MALEMELEMNGQTSDWQIVKEVFEEIGWQPMEKRSAFGIRGFLGNGELFVGGTLGGAANAREIRAEGKHGCHFVVTGDLMFRINNSMYDEAVATIKNVLTQLTERTDMLFVLSFQYEEVRAIRDRERGFEWFWHEPR